MRKTKSPAATPSAILPQADAKQKLDSFLAKYDPDVEGFARRALAKMRKLVPGAVEMVYDNYNWLVIGFSPTERPSEAIFSIVLPPGRVTSAFCKARVCPIRRSDCGEAGMWYETSDCTTPANPMPRCLTIPKSSL